MKKIISGLFICAIAFASCKKDKKEDCTSGAKKIADAELAYLAEQSIANCSTLKAAYQEFLASDCGKSLSADLRAEYQESIEDLICERPN